MSTNTTALKYVQNDLCVLPFCNQFKFKWFSMAIEIYHDMLKAELVLNFICIVFITVAGAYYLYDYAKWRF